MKLLLNIIAFKLGWLSSVFGAANGMPLLGPMVVTGVVALHLWNTQNPSRELLLVALTGAIGASWDSVLVSAGWLSYPSGTFMTGLAPYWILAMWLSFATTLNLSLRWLHSRWLLAALLGAVSGPASYYFGASVGAVFFENQQAALLALSLGWAVLLPLLVLLAQRFDGQSPIASPQRV